MAVSNVRHGPVDGDNGPAFQAFLAVQVTGTTGNPSWSLMVDGNISVLGLYPELPGL